MVFYLESGKNVEGPSVRVVAEELAVFKGKIVKLASGNARIGKEAVEGKKIEDVFSRGAHTYLGDYRSSRIA